MAPTRELAFQIYTETKVKNKFKFFKILKKINSHKIIYFLFLIKQNKNKI